MNKKPWTREDFSERASLGWSTAYCRTYGRRVANPGDTVFVIVYDRSNNRWKIKRDRIEDAFQFASPYGSMSLINYWLRTSHGNTGLMPMEDFWFTLSQAKIAMSRMLFFSPKIERDKIFVEWALEDDNEGK